MSFGSGVGFILGLGVIQEAVEIMPVSCLPFAENFFFSFSSQNPKSSLDIYNRFININNSSINRKKMKTSNTHYFATLMQTKITQAFSFLQKKKFLYSLCWNSYIWKGKKKSFKKKKKVGRSSYFFLFSLEKKRFGGDLITPYKNMK